MEQIHRNIITAAVRAAKTHVMTNANESDRIKALEKLVKAVLELPENDPFWQQEASDRS